MATIVYNPSHDVRFPDNGPIFDSASITANVTVQNTGNSPGEALFFVSLRRGEPMGNTDRKTIPAGGSTGMTASLGSQYFSGSGSYSGWAVLINTDTGEEIDSHSFSLGISQREAILDVVGHIGIEVG